MSEETALAAAMATEEFRAQFRKWRSESDSLRITVHESWYPAGDDDEAPGFHFKAWWAVSPSTIRTALVVTALQELPDELPVQLMLPVVAPELLSPATFVKDDHALPDFLQILADSRENDAGVHDLEAFARGDGAEQTNEDTFLSFDAPVGIDAMKTFRSCVLLQFAAAILLVFLAEAEDAASVAPHSRTRSGTSGS